MFFCLTDFAALTKHAVPVLQIVLEHHSGQRYVQVALQ